ncbi:hypothetical protein B9Z19DRAFT_1089354 [Tuber borchii]|uniref:Secreted protein n=1 Tax=Tuber borchii TaxID=42251 RepID=A0A2T6ZKB2_TUBBO|nr:hypothetical protein B9Z19DRAFT_1089354 [Tuber borchii]
MGSCHRAVLSPWLSRLTLESLLSYSACQCTFTRGGPAEGLCRYVDHPQISLDRELIPPHRRINIGATIPSAALHSLYFPPLRTCHFWVFFLPFPFLLSHFGVGETALVGWFLVLRFTGVVYDLRYHVAFDGMIR